MAIFDDEPTSDWAEMMEAMALAGAMAGPTINLGGVLDGRPDLVRRFRSLDPVQATASFGALLTAPDLQANGCILETLVHLALAYGEGGQKPSDKLVAVTFQFLNEGVCGRMQDPAEDMFVGAVRSPWGNFRVLQGLWEGGAFYLQRFIDVVAHMPAGPGYEDLCRATRALLSLSEAMCERARLHRFQLGAEMPVERLPARTLPQLLMRRRHLRFTSRDLTELGVDPADLVPFTFAMTARANLLGEALGASTLERAPLVREGDTFHLVLPNAVSAAVRYFLVTQLGHAGMKDELGAALGQAYADLFYETALLGGRRGAKLRFKAGATGSFAETMMMMDVGRYIHFLFVTDPLADLDETGLAGINPASTTLGDEFDARITAAHRSVSETEGFRGGLTLIVGCGIGRGTATMFGAVDWPNWRVETCSAYDLVTLSATREFRPGSLWRMLEAREKIDSLGTVLFNVNGLLNLVAWARSLDGHLVPHAQLPDDFADPSRATMLLVEQNRQRELRHASAIAEDLRVGQFLDGRWLRLRRDRQSVFPDDVVAPLYACEDFEEDDYPMSAFLAERRLWWAAVKSPAAASAAARYERWRTVSVWLARAASVLDGLAGMPPGPVLWSAVFEAASAERGPITEPVTYDEARAAIAVETDAALRTITTRASPVYERALFHPENIAERALVAALTKGAAMLADLPDPDAAELDLTPKIVLNRDARHGHAFVARGFRDRIRPPVTARVIEISREDDAYCRLDLGWQVRERNLGGDISGKEECLAFLNKLVAHIEDDLVGGLRGFERQALLEALLANYEIAIADRDRWRRTSAAMIGLHGDTPDTVRTIMEREFKLNAVFQSTRILAEIGLCEARLGEGLKPGQLDLSLMMTKAMLLFEIGGWSDAIRWDVMKPAVRVTPLGDIHANFDFVDEILQPHASVIGKGQIADAVESYGENFEERAAEITIADRLDPLFAEAWLEQFGATIDETRIFIDFVENIGIEAAKAVIVVPRSRFHGIEVEGHLLDDERAEALLERLVLVTRASWRELPPGFEDKDRQPWRFRRRLSFLRRPLLALDKTADPAVLIAPGMVRDSFVYMIANYLRGDFPDQQLSPKMKAWRARTPRGRGTALATKMAAELDSMGWETRIELNMTELLAQGLERAYGDIDVLAWRRDTGRVLAIECKDVQYRKTYGEIAEQLADFRGELKSNGRRDELRKHLDRMDLIAAQVDAVGRFTGIDGLAVVESHLLFRNPVPMEFALAKMREKVRVSNFADISSL